MGKGGTDGNNEQAGPLNGEMNAQTERERETFVRLEGTAANERHDAGLEKECCGGS